jgi:YidC/Oxa1 family membrane protein insertase
MNIGILFDAIIVKPFATILVGIYQALSFLHVPYALGFSIIIFTVIIRFILYPLISSQLKSSKKMQGLTPHISKLKERYKGDAKRMQTETMRLYKEHGVNPVAGCLPLIIQMPVIWGLYSLLQKVVSLNPQMVVSEVNKLIYISALKLTSPWDLSFFGLPLGEGPSKLLSTVGPLVFLVPVVTGILQFLLSKMLIPPKPIGQNLSISKDQKKDDFATAFQTQSTYIFPVMIGFFSYSFPIGLSLYWNTFTIFGIIQQYKILGLGGLIDWKNKIWKKKN